MDISKQSGKQTREKQGPVGCGEIVSPVLDTLDARIAILDSQGVVIAVNAAWRRFDGHGQGWLPPIAEGARYLDACAKSCGEARGEEAEYAQRAFNGVQSVVNRKEAVFEMEYPCGAPDEERWFLMRVTPFADGSGRITVAHHDISGRKIAERSLREQEEKLEDITSNIPGIVFQFAMRPDGSFAIPYFSPRAQELTGVSPEQIANDPGLAFKHIHPDDQSTMFRLIDESARALSRYSVDLRLKTLSGGYRWFHFESTPRRLDDGAIMWNGVAIDITQRKKAEEALKNEAIRRRILVEQSRDGIVVLDENGRVYEANQRYADTLGYTMEEVFQLHVWDWDTQWSRERLLEMIRTVDETGDRFETRHRRKDGSFFDVEISSNGAICDGRKLVFCVCRDITERKRIERALRESESRLQALSDASFEAIFFSDKGVCLDQNKAAERMFGYRYNEAVGRHGTEWVVAEDREQVKKAMLSGYEKPYRVTALRKDGSTFPAEIQGRMFEYQGRSIRVAALRDTTERNRAEEALKKSEERYRLLADNTLDIIWLMDMNTRFTYVNPAIKSMFGYTPEEFIGSNLSDHCDQEQMKRMSGIIADELRRVEERRGVIFETVMWRKDGSPIPVEIHGAFLFDEQGRPVGLQGTTRDITERKRNEATLLESEERYRLLFRNLPSAFALHEIILDGDGQPCDYRFLEVNPAFEKLTGLNADELIGRTVSEALPGTERVWIETYGRVALTGESIHFENYSGDLDRYFEVRAYTQESGRFATIFQDITERKHIEKTLRALAESGAATGKNFFRPLVRQLALSQDARYALIAKIDPDDMTTAHTLVMWNGTEFVENFTYQLLGSPCEKVSSQGPCFIPRDIRNQFPQDRLLAELGAESYWGAPLVDSGGTVIGIMAVIDVEPMEEKSETFSLLRIFSARAAAEMEREGVENALRESEERFRLTFDTSPDSININRLEDGLYVDINQGFTNLTYFTRDEVIGKTSLEIRVWHDERDREELVRGLKEKGYYENLEAQFRRKDGSLTTALMSARVISLGGAPHIISITRDISERKRAEEALKESEERFKILSEKSPLGMALIDQNGRYEYVNPAFVDMFGYDPDEIQTGADWFRLAYPDPEYRKEVMRSWVGDLGRYEEKEVRSRDYEVTCKDGTLKTVLFRPVTISQGKQFIILEDITMRRKLEAQLQQAQKMEAIGTLAGGVSHDFNNLLQAIDGYTQLLLFDKDETDQEYSSLQAIQTACDRAAQLVKQLLLFSRKSATDSKPLDINREVEQARRLLERAIPKMIDIEVHTSDDLWTVKADPVQIEQIFLNLGINAADAMPEGGKLVIETENVTLGDEFYNAHPGAEPGRYALITVSDTGCGMDKETVKHIFEPFYTTKEIGKGTGLGLASVYGIVKSHEGHIACYSEPGLGSTFKIYLPAMKEMDPGVENFLVEELTEGGGETILVVDDEASVRDMASSALKRFGYTILTASNGEEALQVYGNRRDEIDLIIMDLGMPGMGGAKCMREIRRLDPSAQIIIATGYSASSLMKDTLEAGAAGYIGKPYRLAHLLKQVRRVLDKKD